MTGRNLNKLNPLYWQKQAAKQLCKGIDVSGGSGEVDGASLIVDAINEQTTMLDAMMNPRKEITKIDYCIDGVYSGSIVQMWDEKTGALLLVYLNSASLETLAAPTGEICGQGIDYEYKHFDKVCVTDGTDTYYKYVCIPIINGIEQLPINIWFDDMNNKILEPAGTLIPCVTDCSPSVDSFLGNNAILAEFDSALIIIPKCCEVTITTSAGTIVIPSQETKFTFNHTFNCMVTDYEMSSECIDKVYTVLTKSK